MSQEKISIGLGRKPQVSESAPVEKDPIGGRYYLRQKLGRGGVGEVRLGYDLQLERPIAVKRVHLQMGASSERSKMALAEAKGLARLQHPNIVTIFDILEHRGDVMIVMEYLYGYTVEALKGPMTCEDFINLARQSLTGLAAAHSHGMLHLDIKPTNIMLSWLATDQMQVKLLDFGLATVMGSADDQNPNEPVALLGSVHTMAPEQLDRDPVDVRTDLYSLGCVFYFALTLREPFDAGTVSAIIDRHLEHRFAPLASLRPDLPPGLCAWVETLMARRPEDRPTNAKAALTDLFASAPPRRREAPEMSSVEVNLPDQEVLGTLIGKKASVNGVVAHVWENATRSLCFLNFETVNHYHFSVVLEQKGRHPELTRERAETWIGSRVRVTGLISEFHGSPQLVVSSPDQIG